MKESTKKEEEEEKRKEIENCYIVSLNSLIAFSTNIIIYIFRCKRLIEFTWFDSINESNQYSGYLSVFD